MLDAVLDSGITLIDTADCYGMSEETIGRHLSDRRSEYVLATKAGCHRDAPPSGGTKDLTREGLVYNVERSCGGSGQTTSTCCSFTLRSSSGVIGPCWGTQSGKRS